MRPVAEQLAPISPDGWGTTQLRYASTCLDGRRVPLNANSDHGGRESTRIGVPTELLILLMNIFSMNRWS